MVIAFVGADHSATINGISSIVFIDDETLLYFINLSSSTLR